MAKSASAAHGAKVELNIDQRAMKALAKAVRAEADGKTLRKELIAELKAAVAPGVSAVQGKLRSIPRTSAAAWAHGGKESRQALGSYIASRTKAQVRLSGRSPGVKIRIPQTPNIRGFKMAARRLNRTHWRHKVFGRDIWVTQQSPIPGYFDDTLADGRDEYRKGVVKALESMARRIAARV